MAKKKSFENIISNILGEPVSNLCHAFYDQYVETNVKFRSRAGMKEVIIRRQLGKCCKWCADLAGIYEYGNHPDDVFRRHDNCKCMVTYKDEDGYQDVWSKKEFQSQKEAREAREKELLLYTKKHVDIMDVQSYNNSPKEKILKLFSVYEENVKGGWITPLFSFKEYVKLYERIEKEIIGKTTVGGVVIKGQSRHFLQRVIGTKIDPRIYKEHHRKLSRSGVEFEDIVDALFDGVAYDPVYDPVNKRWGQMYKGEKCKVTVNPETGNLIQCNPRGRVKKDG